MTTVFTTKEVVDALDKNENCFQIIQRTGERKTFKGGTYFLDNKVTDIEHDGKVYAKADIWVSHEEEFPISAVTPPELKKPGMEENKPTISFKKSVSGHLGEMFDKLNTQFHSRVDALCESKAIVKGARRVHDIMQYKISENAAENPGGDLEDPIGRIKIEEGNFSPKYPLKFLAGKPKTVILDFDKSYTDDNGIVRYHPATVINDAGEEEALCHANMHKFITPGSICKRIRISIGSTCVSGSWISAQISGQEIIIQSGDEGGFTDAPTPAKTPVVANVVNTTNNDNNIAIKEADPKDVADAINDI